MKLSMFCLAVLLFVLLGANLAQASGGMKSPARVVSQRVIEQEPDSVVVSQQEQQEVPVTTYYNPGAAYRFAYSTGQVESGQYNQQEVAQHFREEQRNALGYVTGKYGYIDPYGKLRVVKYEAGPDGYHAYGDVGPDPEVIQQQRLIHAHDQATRLQQNAWARYRASDRSTASSSSSSDWTAVPSSAAYKTITSHYTNSVKSPAAALRDHSSASSKTVYVSNPEPVVTTYVRQEPTVSKTTTYSRYVDRSPSIVVPVKSRQYTYHYAIPTRTSRIVQKTVYPSPSARLIEIHQGKTIADNEFASSASSSSAATASASASASSSSGGNNHGVQQQQLRSSRYTGPGRAVVNFSSFGPSPYQYSYSY